MMMYLMIVASMRDEKVVEIMVTDDLDEAKMMGKGAVMSSVSRRPGSQTRAVIVPMKLGTPYCSDRSVLLSTVLTAIQQPERVTKPGVLVMRLDPKWVEAGGE